MEILYQEIKKIILSGDTEKALKTFLNKIPKEKRFLDYQKVAQQNLAHFKAVKRKEMGGRISSENALIQYNQINYNVIELLDYFKNGQPVPTELIHKEPFYKKTFFIIPIVIALICSIGFGIYSTIQNAPTACPEFSNESKLNVLLLPFKNLADGKLQPEIGIKNRLDNLFKKHQLKSESNVFNNFYQQKNVQFPSFKDAKTIGQNCDAELVVWGTAEKSNDGIIDMSAKFKLIDQDSKYNLTTLELEGETVVDSLKTISSIAKTGTITKDIEKLILTLFGIVAFENKNFAAAAEALEEVNLDRDTSVSLMTNMLLAESYLEMNDKEKALKSYDKALSIHPDYWLALNNRGSLLIQDGQLEKAEKDFSNIIRLNPANANALAKRALIYAKLNKKDKAIKDVKAAQDIQSDIKVIDISKIRAGKYSRIKRNRVITY